MPAPATAPCTGTEVQASKRTVRLTFNQIAESIRALLGDAIANKIIADFEIVDARHRWFPPLANPREGTVITDSPWDTGDRIAQEANVLLDRVVRQGRAFGIHVVLGSQTLGGAYTLARATMGQMVIRIALQCNEADAQLIMDDNNPAPRFLTRPGEGIYNDMAGAVEGNSPFQTVWLAEDDRDARLGEIIRRQVETVRCDRACEVGAAGLALMTSKRCACDGIRNGRRLGGRLAHCLARDCVTAPVRSSPSRSSRSCGGA